MLWMVDGHDWNSGLPYCVPVDASTYVDAMEEARIRLQMWTGIDFIPISATASDQTYTLHDVLSLKARASEFITTIEEKEPKHVQDGTTRLA